MSGRISQALKFNPNILSFQITVPSFQVSSILMRKKQNLSHFNNISTTSNTNKLPHRKESCPFTDESLLKPARQKQFKPKFILKAKDTNCVLTPTAANTSKPSSPPIPAFPPSEDEYQGSGSRFEEEDSGMGHRDGYEYDDMRETFRKMEEQQQQLQRLRSINRHYRGKMLKMNIQFESLKQKNVMLEAKVQQLLGEKKTKEEQQEAKFSNALLCIGTILREVQDVLGSRSGEYEPSTLKHVGYKIGKVIGCIDQYTCNT